MRAHTSLRRGTTTAAERLSGPKRPTDTCVSQVCRPSRKRELKPSRRTTFAPRGGCSEGPGSAVRPERGCSVGWRCPQQTAWHWPLALDTGTLYSPQILTEMETRPGHASERLQQPSLATAHQEAAHPLAIGRNQTPCSQPRATYSQPHAMPRTDDTNVVLGPEAICTRVQSGLLRGQTAAALWGATTGPAAWWSSV